MKHNGRNCSCGCHRTKTKPYAWHTIFCAELTQQLAQQDTRSTQKPTKSDLKNATTEATQERKEALDE